MQRKIPTGLIAGPGAMLFSWPRQRGSGFGRRQEKRPISILRSPNGGSLPIFSTTRRSTSISGTAAFLEKREKNGRKIFWSRGNGWVLAGLVRVLELLPADHPSRPRFEQQFREMSEKILSCQQSDGFWRSSLLDPENYKMQETSGTGFYCFAFAWGINHGLLDRARFRTCGDAGRGLLWSVASPPTAS